MLARCIQETFDGWTKLVPEQVQPRQPGGAEQRRVARRSALVNARTSDLRRLIDLNDIILERVYQCPRL